MLFPAVTVVAIEERNSRIVGERATWWGEEVRLRGYRHAGTETVRDVVRRAASDALVVVGDVETGAEEGEASSGGAVEPVGAGGLVVFQGLEDGEGQQGES